jgi:hypothetical protein
VETARIQPPSANEFLSRFVNAFAECRPNADEERDYAWTNWTSFMTGKRGRAGTSWEKDAVLEVTAKKLDLRWEHEYLNLDLVLFPSGKDWGNFVCIEHENEIDQFVEELEKLMSVLAPLKVGITYDWRGNAKKQSTLLAQIQEHCRTRHRSILEAPQTEYLFLLGIGERFDSMTWKYLSFTCGDGPEGKRFEGIK